MRVVAFMVSIAMAACLLVHSPLQAASMVLTSDKTGQEVACLALKEGTSVTLEFINSIYQAPVKEIFLYEPATGLTLIRVESPSYGVFEYYGLTPERPGVAELRRPIGDIRIRSHSYRNHRLTVGTESILFEGLVASGEALNMKVRADGSCNP